MEKTKNKPVLLLGLGGIGTKIISKIYHEIPDKERNKVIIHAFDTDLNDVLKLGMKSSDVTITSSDLTVEKCLVKENIRRSNAREWFPDEHQAILSTKFSDGAGQVRAISRLAYMDSIGEGKLKELENKLELFSQLDGLSYDNDVRVTIVSSLAGGTGAGIFLQTALFVKDYFNSRGKSVKIRGSFVLPDILIKNNIINGAGEENTRANAYACLKELDAIIKSTMSTEKRGSINIQLAYKPDMVDEKVTVNPYDFIFLYDYENLEGKHLGRYQDYLDQIAKILYLQLFSEVAGANDSDEINSIIHITENNGRARYASAGVATLVYPYKDILNYSAYRLASENIGENWLNLDKKFLHEVEELEILKKQNVHKEFPKKYIRLNELFDNEVANKNIFFANINRELYLQNAEGELGDKKVDRFLDELKTYVINDLSNSKEYKELYSYDLDTNKLLSDPEEMKITVSEYESILEKARKSIINSLDNKITMLSSNIMPIHFIEKDDMKKFKYQPAYWILGGEDKIPLHPLASRYFLYEVKQKLLVKIAETNDVSTSKKSQIDEYFNNFEDGKTARELASDYALNATKFFSLGKRKWKKFADEYSYKATDQCEDLKTYNTNFILNGIYKNLLTAVEDLIQKEEEPFFNALNELMVEFNREYIKLSKLHEENSADVSKVYTLSKAEHKDKLYSQYIRNLDTDDVLKASYFDIFMEKYNRFASRKKKELITETLSIKELYKNKILDSYRNKINESQVLDFNVIDSLRKEISFNDINPEQQNHEIKKAIQSIENRAKPFAMKRGASGLALWGVNPEISRTLGENT